MATFDYSRTADTALRLITKFGQIGIVQRLVSGNGPANNPGKPVPQDYPARMVVIDFGRYTQANNLVQAGSKRALVAAKGLSIDIEPQDILVEASGKRWVVIKPNPLQPDGVTFILYDCEVVGV